MNFFDLAPQDQSIYYLGKLFGSVGDVIQPNGPGATVVGLLGMMFRTFNTTALVLGSIIVTYTTVVGLLKTAQEGEFLGKNWGSMWVPIRMVMGIAALFPTTSGYSALQVLMMWVIVQGAGAADTLWNTVINFVALTGSPYATISIPVTGGVSQNMQNLFQALTCEATALRRDGDTTSDKTYYYFCGDPANQNPFGPTGAYCYAQQPMSLSSCTEVTSAGTPYMECNIGPGGQCGKLQYSDVKAACADTSGVGGALQCVGDQAQQTALTQIVSNTMGLEALAAEFAELDHQYLAFYANTNPAPPPLWYGVYDTSGNCTATEMALPDWIHNYCEKGANINSDGGCCVVNKPPAAPTATNDRTMQVGDQTVDTTPQQTAPTAPSVSCIPSGAQPPLGGKLSQSPDTMSASACADTNSQTGPFYGATAYSGSGSSATPDSTNANPSAVSKIYWTYGLKPLLTSTSTAANSGTSETLQLTNNPDFIGAATTYYAAYISEQLANEMTGQPSVPVNLNDWQSSAENLGWIMAGAYYYELANQNDSNTVQAIPLFNVIPGNVTDASNKMSTYRNNASAVNALVQGVQVEAQPPGSVATTVPAMGQVGSQLNGLASSVAGDFMSALTSGPTNPLVALQHLGRNLIITATVMYAVFLAIAIVLLTLSSINVIALGFGLTENPTENFVKFVIGTIWTILMAFMVWCITFGGMLAVYVPLIPYVLFTMGAIGWLTATIEAMVAAPLVALGILSPGGQSELFGRGSPVIMIMLNIFLRPSLMIFGMMTSMLLAPIVVAMINSGFKGVMGSISGNPGLPELLMFMIAYCTIILTALNKCFSLIHVIPTNVLGWIEGGGKGAGVESSSEGDLKGAVTGAASSVGAGAKGGAQAGASGVQARGKDQDKTGKATTYFSPKGSSGDGGTPPPTDPPPP